MIPNLQV
jgi:hypothetical protein